jgi:hypothetical protein
MAPGAKATGDVAVLAVLAVQTVRTMRTPSRAVVRAPGGTRTHGYPAWAGVRGAWQWLEVG